MSICTDPIDQERDDILSKIKQLSHFDDRTVQYVEVLTNMHLILLIIFPTAKVVSAGSLDASI